VLKLNDDILLLFVWWCRAGATWERSAYDDTSNNNAMDTTFDLRYTNSISNVFFL